MHVEMALLYQIATVLNAILNIPTSPIMTKWHHSDSSKVMSEVQESVKKKTLDANSRSNWFSAGLKVDIIIQNCFSKIRHVKQIKTKLIHHILMTNVANKSFENYKIDKLLY